MREQTESAAKTFKEFAYAVSHDLGTPLRAMIEFSRLLKEEHPRHLSKEEELYLSMIIENGEKAQAMLRGLLEYSRLNTVVHPFRPADCGAIAEASRDGLADKISARKAEITCEELPTLIIDSEQMKRLLTVLLDNALTFHAKNKQPCVTLSAKPRQSDWVFTVRDNGIGIDSRFHDRIFEPFRKLHPDGEYPGVGMGLALAKKVVQHHGGHIWVDSIPGQGSAFMFSIPERKGA